MLMSHIESASWAPHAKLFPCNDSYHAYALVEAVEAVEETKLGCNYLSQTARCFIPHSGVLSGVDREPRVASSRHIVCTSHLECCITIFSPVVYITYTLHLNKTSMPIMSPHVITAFQQYLRWDNDIKRHIDAKTRARTSSITRSGHNAFPERQEQTMWRPSHARRNSAWSERSV